jgi:hypothetical protein
MPKILGYFYNFQNRLKVNNPLRDPIWSPLLRLLSRIPGQSTRGNQGDLIVRIFAYIGRLFTLGSFWK